MLAKLDVTSFPLITKDRFNESNFFEFLLLSLSVHPVEPSLTQELYAISEVASNMQKLATENDSLTPIIIEDDIPSTTSTSRSKPGQFTNLK